MGPILLLENELYAVAIDDCRLSVIERANLELLLDQSASLAGELTMYGKPGALYCTLIRPGNTFGEKREYGIVIRHKLTHSELGNDIGAARRPAIDMVAQHDEGGE